MTYRLAIDVGTNSVGWCALRLDASGAPSGIADMGVRIFHDSRDPQSGTSLAGDRRVARGARRRRDRYLKRRDRLMTALARHGLMPSDAAARKALEGLDAYELRARALDQALTPHETGRALFHLSQRRGFKSNRIAQGGAEDEKEDGLIRAGVSDSSVPGYRSWNAACKNPARARWVNTCTGASARRRACERGPESASTRRAGCWRTSSR